MIPALASGVVPWLIAPACGALVGAAVGYFVLGRLALSLLLRNRSTVFRAASRGVETLTGWVLSLRVRDLALDRKSPTAVSLEAAIAETLRTVLSSRAVIYAVRDAVSRLVAGLAVRKVGEVSRAVGFPGLLAGNLLPAFSREETREAVARAAGTFVAAQAGRALSDEALHKISELFDSYLPEAADALVRWLRSPETRAYLSDRGRELIPKILEKLSDLQKLFISAGQFDRKLNEKMPEIVDDTIAAAEKTVRDRGQQERISALFFESAQGWRDSLLVTPSNANGPGIGAKKNLADSATTLLDRFLERLADPEVRQSIEVLVSDRLDEDHRTIGAFVRDTFGIRDSEIVETLSARVLDFLVRRETAQSIARTICGLLFDLAADRADATIGDVLGIDEEKKRRLEESLRARVPRFVEDLVPEVSRIVSVSFPLAGVSTAAGAGMGFMIGVILGFLRLLG